MDKYTKVFYNIENHRYLSASEIEEARENLNKLKKCLSFKKSHGNIDSVDYDDLDNYVDNYDFADDNECRKIGCVRALFKVFDRDYYKPIRTDDDCTGRRNNYIEYKSTGNRYEHLPPKGYFKMIRPYLRDMINDHKPTTESNNEENEKNGKNNSNVHRAE